MTRKDYKLIAAALREAKPEGDNMALATWQLTVNNIATALAGDNPRFDYQIFLKACDNWQTGKR